MPKKQGKRLLRRAGSPPKKELKRLKQRRRLMRTRKRRKPLSLRLIHPQPQQLPVSIPKSLPTPMSTQKTLIQAKM